MLITPKSLYKYFHSLKFPVTILHEKGAEPALSGVKRHELARLIERDLVFGVGSYTTIRHLRMMRSDVISELRIKLGRQSVFAEDNKTTTVDPDLRVIGHHAGRSLAYSMGRTRIVQQSDADGNLLAPEEVPASLSACAL